MRADGFYDVEYIDGDRTVARVEGQGVQVLGYVPKSQEQVFGPGSPWKVLRGPYEISAPEEKVRVMTALWDGGFDEKGKNMDPAFAPYRTRLAKGEDTALAREWTEADPAHRGRMTGEFWTDQKGCQSRVLYKGDRPMFFFRLEHLVRIYIQFPPPPWLGDAELRTALEGGMAWLGSVLAGTGARELVFDSTAKLLRRFCLGKLGFTAEPDTLKRTLAPPPSEAQ